MDVFFMSDTDTEEVKQIEKDCQVGPWSLLDYKNEIQRPDGLALVIKEQNHIIGFTVARLIKIPKLKNYQTILETKTELETELEIEIYNIAIKPAFQNQGIGQKLINQLINNTINLQPRSIWLEVRESNTKATRFYKKNEFTEILKRKNFYSNPVEDGILMKKLINF